MAYEYALKSCDNKEHKSDGCELLAHLIINGKTKKANNLSYDEE